MQVTTRLKLDREEERQRARDDAFSAWRQYKVDGLHVTADEADGWLVRLEAGEEVDPPECHG